MTSGGSSSTPSDAGIHPNERAPASGIPQPADDLQSIENLVIVPISGSSILEPVTKPPTTCIMPQGKEMFLGLNQNGLIAFIVLLLLCFPLAWIPWLVDACKADPKKPIE